jgi:hypothetical protein
MGVDKYFIGLGAIGHHIYRRWHSTDLVLGGEMKRRNFLKGMLAAPFVAPVAAKTLPNNDGKTEEVFKTMPHDEKIFATLKNPEGVDFVNVYSTARLSYATAVPLEQEAHASTEYDQAWITEATAETIKKLK